MNFHINIEDIRSLVEKAKKEKSELGKVIYPILDRFELNKQEILEVCQIGKFVCKIDSEIRIEDKPKPPNPDFIISYQKNLIGLEHTQILTYDAGRFFKIKTLLDYAEQIFEKKYPNINVHATVSIQNDQWDYRQKDKPKLAGEIADLVQWSRLDLVYELPEKITKIKTTKHSQVTFTYKEVNWQAENLTRERLREEILKKERKISGYQKSEKELKELWLVLLIGSLSSVSYELDESENYRMESKYDRVYLLSDFEAKILRIK